MLELPEVLTMASQLQNTVVGKTVSSVLPPTKVHKFCWFSGEPEDYSAVLQGQKIIATKGFGIYVELLFDGGNKLCFNDGVNVRFMPIDKVPKNYQLLIALDDGTALVFTVAMYGGINLHKDNYDNEYYVKSIQAISPFSPEFESYFNKLLGASKPTLSAKAFIATEQRFPGIGNGSAQDILFVARIHPKRKLQTFSEEEKKILFNSIISVLGEMVEKGGRDTEKDLYGNPGGYLTKMSKNTVKLPCPVCGGDITKEAYMGGSVYYCGVCQRKD